MLLVFAGLAFGACAPETRDRPVVAVQDSTYTGTWSAGRDVASFLGIPFAEPPVGARRWQEPERISRTVEVDASRFATACMQGQHMVDWYQKLVTRFGGDPATFPVPEFSEDCLFLNVWTPSLKETAGLPVMVWIHGGGHRGGWPNEPNYFGDELAREGVIVVSIAYRLDVFGFFSHPDLEYSNFGLLDQLAALRWVRDNIGHFGGDAGNVTVFGESAGASSIAYLMASPLAEGLFRRAIHQSAGYELVNFDRREQFLDLGTELERRVLVAHDASGIESLRHAPAQELLEAADDVYAGYRPDVVVDGHSLTETVRDALNNDRLQVVDLLIGSNADEWLMYLDPSSDESDLAARADEYAITDIAGVLAELSADTPVLRKLDRLITAHEFVCPSLELAALSGSRKKASYAYYFSRVRAGSGGDEIGAYHGTELPYVFDKHDHWLPTSNRDREISDLMKGYWTAFARSGDPNFSGAPRWPQFSLEKEEVLEIGDLTHVIRHPEADLCKVMGR
jgi:para-nitrobenzyl esterase